MINEHSLTSPVFSRLLVFLFKFLSFSMSGRFFEVFPNLPVVPVAVRTIQSRSQDQLSKTLEYSGQSGSWEWANQ